MHFAKTTVAILICIVSLRAQNGSWWEPAFPTVGDTITIYFDATQSSEIPDGATSLVLHWGVNELSAGEWQLPPSEIRPPGTVIYTGGDPAARTAMINVSGIWQIKIPTTVQINTLHYVVNTGTPENPGGSWGHNTGNSNWNIQLSEMQIRAIIVEPEVNNSYGDQRRSPAFANLTDTLEIIGTAGTNNTDVDSLFFYLNNEEVARLAADTIRYNFIAAEHGKGFKTLALIASDTTGVKDTTFAMILVNDEVKEQPRPVEIVDGINYMDQSTVILSLFAPYKEFIYVIGDFNDWMVDTLFYMQREIVDEERVHWWLTIEGLEPGQEYAFQYLVDGSLRIADPYTEKVLDPWHDQEIIDKGLYPNLKSYPAGKTTEPAGVLQTNRAQYNWQHSENFVRLPKHELIIYELLIRDFLQKHDYSTLIDTLDYLDNLGINAIELMPVNEFEGNSSWGYNPSFYFAPDKYYGPADSLKKFIDKAHQRGIAVIIDMVLNHSYGQSPLVRLYFKDNKPTAQNPWYNVVSPNPVFSWGYDFDHESAATQIFVDRVNAYWLNEFKVDGFRFDFTKGFTNTPGDGGDYDISRVNILKRMADKLWLTDSTAYMILEHFSVNDEERDLTHYKQGMMVWGNANYNYNEATMGYHDNGKSDFSWAYYDTRPGWTEPNLVSYMESHDEERLMFKNLAYGNGSGTYQIQQLETALNRIKMAAAFFFTYPGAKMIWQFGELGYDISIDDPCRVCEKPIRWDYVQDPLRHKLYKTYAALINLRKSAAAFTDPDASVELMVSTALKRIRIGHRSMNVIIIGNFDVVAGDIDPGFYYGGTWYDYFSGNGIPINDTSEPIHLAPGEFFIYTDKKLPTPDEDILNSIETEPGVTHVFSLAQNYPNPFNPSTTIAFELAKSAQVEIKIFDILGREVTMLLNDHITAGKYEIKWDGKNRHGIYVGSGVFIYHINATSAGQSLFNQSRKMVLLR